MSVLSVRAEGPVGNAFQRYERRHDLVAAILLAGLVADEVQPRDRDRRNEAATPEQSYILACPT